MKFKDIVELTNQKREYKIEVCLQPEQNPKKQFSAMLISAIPNLYNYAPCVEFISSSESPDEAFNNVYEVYKKMMEEDKNE